MDRKLSELIVISRHKSEASNSSDWSVTLTDGLEQHDTDIKTALDDIDSHEEDEKDITIKIELKSDESGHKNSLIELPDADTTFFQALNLINLPTVQQVTKNLINIQRPNRNDQFEINSTSSVLYFLLQLMFFLHFFGDYIID